MKGLISSDKYNFSFTFNILKCFSHLIDTLFDDDILDEAKLEELVESFIALFLSTRDTREVDSFKENIFKKIAEKVNSNQGLKKAFMKCLFEKASSKEDMAENKRRLLFKIYKHLKYSGHAQEDENTGAYSLEDVIEIDEVDPVNQVALRANYTNVNLTRKLKKRIVNSVLKQSKRAKEISEEWQAEREKENTKDEEQNDKENQENNKESPQKIPFSIIKKKKADKIEKIR